MKGLFQSGDWAKEKHVPVVEILEADGSKGVKIRASVGKEIPHPNTTEHHIRWIEVYFQPRGEKFPYQIGRFEFNAHGESVQGINTSTIYTQPSVKLSFKTEKPGIILASSYCNIHGLWESSQELAVE